jgi:hypothetical protein
MYSPLARLYVKLTASGEAGRQPELEIQNWTVQATEWVSLWTNNETVARPGSQQASGGGLQAQAPYDVTGIFSPAGPAETVVGGFAPPGTNLGGGAGYPVRFWRLELLFQAFVPLESLPFPATPPAPQSVTIQGIAY